MTELGVDTPRENGRSSPGAATGQRSRNPVIRSSKRLPSGRAVLGGLLITLAVFGVLLASRLSENAEFRDVVVARADLAPGTVLGPDNITQARIRLDDGIDTVVSDPERVYGSVLLGPAGELELIQWSSLVGAGTAQGLATVSVAVAPERAPAQLRSGELVSILATFDDDPDTTELIADRITVLSYLNVDGFGGDAVLRLGLDDGDIAAAIIHASQTGTLSVVGVTGAPDVELAEITSR